MIIRFFLLFLITLSISIFPASAHADMVFPDTNTAMEQLDQQRSKLLASRLQQNLHSKSAAESAQILQLFVSKEDQNIVETEYALWQLALSARSQSGDQLDPEVLAYLTNYNSRSRIQHPENIDASLPLFNIRATVTGAISLRKRQQDLEIAQSLEQQPSALLNHYLQTPPLSQAALRQAAVNLPAISRNQLLAISLIELNNPQSTKAVRLALISLSSDLALAATNVTALSAIIATGEGLPLPRLLIQLNDKLPAEQSKVLLYQASKLSPQIAAIAIGELAEFASTDTEVYAQLFLWLDDPQLGSAAALALSTTKQQNLTSELRQLSTSKQTHTANNAQLALYLLDASAREQQQ